MDGWTDREMHNGWMDGSMDGEGFKKTDGRNFRPTDTHILWRDVKSHFYAAIFFFPIGKLVQVLVISKRVKLQRWDKHRIVEETM